MPGAAFERHLEEPFVKPRVVLIALPVVAVALALLPDLLLPRTWRVERSVVAQTNTNTIGPYVSELRQWRGWTTWVDAAYDPRATYSYQGKKPGVGQVMRWDGPRVGEGRLEITSSAERTGIAYREKVGPFTGHGRIAFAAEGSTVRVTWTDEGDAGWNPLARLRLGAMRRRIASRIAGSLAHLKDLSEHTLQPPGKLPPEVMTITPQDLR